MSRASMKAKKKWRRRRCRSTFKRKQVTNAFGPAWASGGWASGGSNFTGGPSLDLPALIAQVNRLFRGRSTPRG